MFNPGGSTGLLRVCPFSERGVRCFMERFLIRGPDNTRDWSVFWPKDDLGISFSREGYTRLVCIAVDRCFSAARLV